MGQQGRRNRWQKVESSSPSRGTCLVIVKEKMLQIDERKRTQLAEITVLFYLIG